MSTPEPAYDFQRSMKNVSSYPFIHKYLPFDRYFIRPPAALLVKAVFKTSVTPNQLTICSFLFGLTAGVLYLGGSYAYFAAAGSLALVSTIFDAADGMLARGRGQTSRYGAFLDLFLDRIADFVVLAGATFGYYRHTQSLRFLVFGLVTIGLYFLQVSLYYINNLYVRSRLPHLRLFPGRPPGRDPSRGLPDGLPRHDHQAGPVPSEGEGRGGGSGPLRDRADLFLMRGTSPIPAQISPMNRRMRMTAMPADISIRSRAKRET